MPATILRVPCRDDDELGIGKTANGCWSILGRYLPYSNLCWSPPDVGSRKDRNLYLNLLGLDMLHLSRCLVQLGDRNRDKRRSRVNIVGLRCIMLWFWEYRSSRRFPESAR
jgi:hypothetical protein